MTRKITLPALVLLLCIKGFAQRTISESAKMEEVKFTKFKLDAPSGSNLLYAERIDDKGHGERFYIDIFDPSTLKLQSTIDANLQLPEGQACVGTKTDFVNDELTVFYTIDAKQEGKFYITFQKYSKTGQKIGGLKELYNMSRVQMGQVGRPELQISENHAYVLLTYGYEYRGLFLREYHFVVMNRELKTLTDKKIDVPDNEHMMVFSTLVTNNGDLVMGVGDYDKGSKVYGQSIRVLTKSNNYAVKELDMLTDMKAYATSIQETYDLASQKMYIAGKYSERGEEINVSAASGIYYLVFDMASGSFIKHQKIAFSPQLIKDTYPHLKEPAGLTDLYPLMMACSGGKIKLVMERNIINAGVLNTFNELYVFVISDNQPSVMEEKVIIKNQQAYPKSLGQPYWACLPIMNGEDMVIYYNDFKDRNSLGSLAQKGDRRLKTTKELLSEGALKKAVITADGKVSVQDVMSYTKDNEENYFVPSGAAAGANGELYWHYGELNKYYKLVKLR